MPLKAANKGRASGKARADAAAGASQLAALSVNALEFVPGSGEVRDAVSLPAAPDNNPPLLWRDLRRPRGGLMPVRRQESRWLRFAAKDPLSKSWEKVTSPKIL